MALGRGNIEINVRAAGLGDSIASEVRTAERNIRPLSVSLNDKGFRQPLGRITGDLGEFQNALDASVARTLAFGAAVGVINSMANAFKGMVTSAIEVEKALADVNVILNLTSSGLVAFSSNLFQVAQNTGQSFQTVSEAAIELARQGLGAEESLKRINDAMILTRLSGMDAAKSVASLTAAVNSFGNTAVTTTEVVNKLASVDAAFAVSTDDLANALSRAGASAQGAKVDMDQLLAAVTSVQQTTARGGAVIGNAFKSIFTRLQRGGVREALEEIGVATTDAAGNIRGAMSVLQDYAGVYGTLTDSQRAYTDELIAGVFQINNLKALIKDLGSDYSIYTRALDQSASATDEAERRNKSLQTTLSALVNESSVSVKKLASALGTLVATPAIENLLTVFNSVAGALSKALDPEKGSKLIKGMFGAIGKFIAGPGLLIVGLAFVKLFKFITGQSVRAVSEVFKINSAAQKTAQIEGQITGILSTNKELYERISNEALSHEQREEMVLQTLAAQTAQYKNQAAMISRLGRSRAVGSAVRGASGAAEGFVPRHAGGYIPNFANGIEGAVAAEREAIIAGEGGASPSASTKVLNNFPIGGGRNQTMVANTDEVIVPKFGGSSGSAIFNKDMISQNGMPEDAIPVARGFVPNFIVPGKKGAEKKTAGKAGLRADPKFSQFWNGSGEGSGTLKVDTQEATQGFGIIGGRGPKGLVESGMKQPFADDNLGGPFRQLVQKKLGVTSSQAKEFMDLFSKRKTVFGNIPVNSVSNEPITRQDGENRLTSPISNIIQPYMATAVEKVATDIYTNYFPRDFDTAGYVAGVRSAADRDSQIVSTSVEGGVLESALKLGSIESAKNIGKDESATWDFEPGGSIPSHLKKNFFSGKKVSRADAKRTVNDSEKRKVLKKATDEVFPAQLAAGMLGAIQPKVLKEAKQAFERRKSKADGFIPSFANGLARPKKIINRLSEHRVDDEKMRPRNAFLPRGEEKGAKKKGAKKKGASTGKAQKADPGDVFSATIIPEYQKYTGPTFQNAAGRLTNSYLKGSEAPLNMFKKLGADPSNIDGMLTSKETINGLKDYINSGQDSTNLTAWQKATRGGYTKKSFTSFLDRKLGKELRQLYYGAKIKPPKDKKLGGANTGTFQVDDHTKAFKNRVQGILGEVMALKRERITRPDAELGKGNSFFDLSTGKEVKTVTGKQSAREILKKGANEYLQNKDIFNNIDQKIKLRDFPVVLPRGTSLAKAAGFIPNFANSLDEAISREKEVLQAQGSSAQVYTGTDSRVAGPKNPAGLLVANTRDEPRGAAQGVKRALTEGENPKTYGAATGLIPSFARRRGSSRGADTSNIDGATDSVNALNKASGKLKGGFQSLKGGMSGLETLSFKAAGLEIALQGANSVLEILGMDTIPTMTDMVMHLKDAVQGINRDLVTAADRYADSLEKEISATTKAVEQIDLFASTTSALGKSIQGGKIEVAGKQLQLLFVQAAKMKDIDPSKLQELVAAAGDSEAIARVTQELKDLTERGKDVKMFAADFSKALSNIQQEGKGEKRDKKLEETDVKPLVNKLLSGLDPEQLAKVGEKLKDIDTSSAKLSEVLTDLGPEIGDLPEDFKKLSNFSRVLSTKFLEGLKAQTIYAASIAKLSEQFQKFALPVESLASRLGALGEAMEATSQSTSKAYEVLRGVADIEFKSRLEAAGSTGTVTASTGFDATAIYDVRKSIEDAAQTSKTAISGVTSQLIKTAASGTEGGATELSGPIAALVKSVEGGSIDNGAALAAAATIASEGNTAQQTLAKELITTLRSTNQAQLDKQVTIEATLKAQLAAIDNQAIAYARNNQLSSGQLDALSGVSSGINVSTGIQKTNLQKMSELSGVMKTIGSLGGSNTQDFLAEMKESNAKLSQLENFKAALNQVTEGGGVPANFDAESLEGLSAQIDKFVGEGSFNRLGEQAKGLMTALDIGLDEQMSGSAGGVMGVDDIPPSIIDERSINDLANRMGEAVSESVGALIGVDRETAEGLKVEDVDESLPAEISALAAQNKTNMENNAALMKQQTAIIVKAVAASQTKQSETASALLEAAKAINEAAVNLAKVPIVPIPETNPSAAKGFVPSFSPNGAAVKKAISTERKLGGRPVVDYHSSVGTYVRDGKTQPNFSAVKRDHPEGIRKASDNASKVQGVLAGDGYVPNFKSAQSTTVGVGLRGLKWGLGLLGSKKKIPVKLGKNPRSGFDNLKDSAVSQGKGKKGKSVARTKKEDMKEVMEEVMDEAKPGVVKRTAVGAVKLATIGGVTALASKTIGDDGTQPTIADINTNEAGEAVDPKTFIEEQADFLQKQVAKLEAPFTGRDFTHLDDIIPDVIKDFGSQFPEVVAAAYFGGHRYSDPNAHPPFVDQEGLGYAYTKAAHTMFNSGKTDLLKNIPEFKGDGSLDTLISGESKTDWAEAMRNFSELGTRDFAGLLDWNTAAPQNDTWMKGDWGLFGIMENLGTAIGLVSMAMGAAGLASLVAFPPAAPVLGAISAIGGTIGGTMATLGSLGDSFTGVNADGFLGITQKNRDLEQVVDQMWAGGMFHEEAPNYGWEADMIPRTAEEASADKLKLQTINKERGAALREAFGLGAITLSPSLFPGVSSTTVGVGEKRSQMAGATLVGSQLSENEGLRTFLETGGGAASVAPEVGVLSGGPDFITNLDMVQALMARVGEFAAGGEEGKLNLPLTLGAGGNLLLKKGTDLKESTWVPSSQTSRWSMADLKKTADQLFVTKQEGGNKLGDLRRTSLPRQEAKVGAQEDPNEEELDKLADLKAFELGLVDQDKGLGTALSLVQFYERMLGDSAVNMADSAEWMRKPTFPDPFKQKEFIKKSALVNDAQVDSFYGFERPDLSGNIEASIFDRGDGKASATEQLNDFFEKLFDRGKEGGETTKSFIDGALNKESGRITSLFDPGVAKGGYEAANSSLSKVQEFLAAQMQGPIQADAVRGGIDAGAVARVEEKMAGNAAGDELAEKVFKEGLFEGEGIKKFEGENKIPTNPPDLEGVGKEEEEGRKTNVEQVRDAVYMRILGKQADEKRATSRKVEMDTIKRIEKVRETSPNYKAFLGRAIGVKEKHRAGRQKTADKWKGTSRHSEKLDLVAQTEDEIAALTNRADSFSQGEKGLAELYYSSVSRKPALVNGRAVAPAFWEAPSTSLEAFNALVKRLGIEQTPAEERLKELKKNEGGDRGIAGQLGLNWSDHLTDEQKSKNVGGYGFYAQIRGQSGNEGGAAFRDQFSSMAPEDRIQLMERLGVRAVEPDIGGSKLYDDLFSGNSAMAPLVKQSLMRFAGESNPAFGFMLDQIFQSNGANRERDAILNTIKDLGVPFNDVSPIGELLKSAKVNIATLQQPGGSEVDALLPKDVSTMVDYLYDEQFNDWSKRNEEKLKGKNVGGNIAYLNEILGEKNSKDLVKYPSYLEYLSNGGMLETSLEQHIGSILESTDSVENAKIWKTQYPDNYKVLTSNADYGATIPSDSARTVPAINPLTGENQLKSLGLGPDITTQAQAVPAVMGNNLTHGINSAFESLVNPEGNPFPALGKPPGRDEAIRKLREIAEEKKGLSYAPFGYRAWLDGSTAPTGKTEMIKTLIQMIDKPAKVANGQEAEEKARRPAGPQFRDPFADMSEEERTEMAQKAIAASKRIKEARVGQDIDAAAGLVPNFAEILEKKKGSVKLINDEVKRYIQTGEGSSAILEGGNDYLIDLPGDSSYLTSQIGSMAKAVKSQEVSLASLGIPANRVKGLTEKSELALSSLNVPNMVVDIKKLKRGSSLDLGSSSSQTGIRGASGFVPNFSAVAGEIAASQAAGYKSPVTSSQVKTMNIPGAGKAAYNTQESVFKMPGVVQPFIRPPKSSDAAPSYAKEVKKKYNFNPYPNAAGGFVPNFKGGALDTTAFEQAIRAFADDSKKFGESTTTFQAAVSGLNFSVFEKAGDKMAGASDAFAKQSTVLSAAASKIKDGAEKIAGAKSTSIDFKPLTSAAGLMSASAGKMAQSLGAPLDLNTKTLEDTMNNLITALGAIGGQITVDISPVTIDIQGGGAIELSGSTKDAISSDVTSIVASEINKKVPAMIKSHLT
mgnify:CR=1 FL=1